MAKFKTETFEVTPRIKFQIRVTPKKIYIDRITSRGYKQVWWYIERVLAHPHRNDYIYTARKPNANWARRATTLREIIETIEAELDMEFPQEAVDMFESRLLSEVMING